MINNSLINVRSIHNFTEINILQQFTFKNYFLKS